MPLAVRDDSGVGVRPVGAVEVGEDGERAGTLDPLEHRAIATGAALLGGAEEDAAAVRAPGTP